MKQGPTRASAHCLIFCCGSLLAADIKVGSSEGGWEWSRVLWYYLDF